MSTKTDLYIGRGHDAEWIGSLQGECDPENMLRVPPGRLALTARDEATYRDAVQDLLTVWAVEEIGHAYPPRTGWPWPWPTSHVSSWIIAYDPDEAGVFVTVGGGTRWERIDPRAPRPPANEDDELGPPDLQAWLDNPAAPPSVPMPLMRDPATGEPTHLGGAR
jgi:hypothetical protein